MFCPQCGSTQSDELKFCKSCGANLHALRQVMATRDAEGKFDWSKTWVADMFMSVGEDGSSRVSQVDPGMTPEMKRQREIKAGVITASVGIGLMILLFVLMTGIIAGGRVSDAAAEILSRLWIVGVIPFMVGAALIFNGMFVGRNTKQLASARETPNTKELSSDPVENYLPPADTNDLGTGGPFSVTDETTRQLQGRRK
jgi:hypothetical protein